MSSVIIRVDGSIELGLGHVMRSLAVADGLRHAGADVIFATRSHGSEVPNLIRSKGYPVEKLPADADSAEDLRLTLGVSSRHNVSLIVTDICHRQSLANTGEFKDYHNRLRRACFVVCIAGGLLVDIPSDIVISPYYRRAYPEPSGGSKWLLGPDYFVFRAEFPAAARIRRTIAERGQRLLVTMGGADEFHFTVKTIDALTSLQSETLSLRVVLGPAFQDKLRRRIEKAVGRFEGDCQLVPHDANLADLMLWADVALTNDGLTKYETAVTGTPSLMLSHSGSEPELNEDFEEVGSSHCIGHGLHVTTNALAGQVASLLGDVRQRILMSRRGKQMVDGRGLQRILDQLPLEVLP